LFARLAQRDGRSGLGHPGPRLYELCGSAGYHDIVDGTNGDYWAADGYDLVTGLGTPNVGALLNAY
jgi:kumamolisin